MLTEDDLKEMLRSIVDGENVQNNISEIEGYEPIYGDLLIALDCVKVARRLYDERMTSDDPPNPQTATA